MFELPPVSEDSPLPWWVELEPVDPQDFDNPAEYMTALLADVATRPVGPRLLTGLDDIDASLLSPNDAVTYLQLWEKANAWSAGKQADATATTFETLTRSATVETDDPTRFVTAELAAANELAPALRIAPRTADKRVQMALDLAGPTEPLRAAMLRGEVSSTHVAAISRELGNLPAAGNLALAQEFTDQCAERVTSGLAHSSNARQGVPL